MSILSDIKAVLDVSSDIPFETGRYADAPEGDFGVILPLTDVFMLHADNAPGIDTQYARLEVFVRGNYTQEKNSITAALLDAGFIITGRGYAGYEEDTGYHHFYIDAALFYETEE